MGISVEKWLVMGSLALISGALGFAPYFLLKRLRSWGSLLDTRAYHQTLTVLSCAGGGVLLSTALVHMLPENREGLASVAYVQNNLDDHFPLAEILTISGFALIYLIEELAGFMLGGGGEGHGHGHSHSMPRQSPFRRDTITRHSAMAHGIPGPIPGGPRSSFLSTGQGSCIGIEITPPADADSKTELTSELAEEAEVGSQLRSFLALLALSFHAIMEGIAIGIQNSSNLWLMFGAIASHKFVISFCMGMELCASQARLRTFVGSIVIFAVLSPLGIFIGSYLTEDDATKTLPVCILEGFATGTILYVVFFEILSRERERRSGTGALSRSRLVGFVQFLSLLIGLIGMTCLLTLTHGHEEEEEEGHEH